MPVLYTESLHEFISILSDQENSRQEFAVIQTQLKREKKKAEAAK
jgi:hypothetical protein